MAKEVKKEEATEVQEVISTTGQWIIRNQNILMWCLVGILAVIVGIMMFNNYYLKPKSAEASDEIAKAVVYFAQDNYETALNGDEADCIGFEAIADKYSITRPGKLAALYAGICYYNTGDYEQAVKYLKKYSAEDLNVAPAAAMKLGDAYAQLDETEKAAKAFLKAAKSGNEVIAPIALKKAGVAYMSLDNKKAAKKAFTEIKEKYPQSSEAQDIDKFISLVEK